MTKDKVFATPQTHVADFAFNDSVAQVFEDMINRSVPGYELTLEMFGLIAERYTQANTTCYDMGCSLGASTFALAQKAHPDCRVVGIDNSQAMITRAQDNVKRSGFKNIHLLLDDVRKVPFEQASLITSNFTLQFIPVEDRHTLLQRVADALLPNGAFVLSEKINFNEAHYSNTMIDLYHAFKKGRGYSDLEIAQKRSALENVLRPETINTHTQRLLDAGFSEVFPWYQCFNFCSMIAIK